MGLAIQQRFAAAQADGHFKAEIVPVEVPGKGPTQFDNDERTGRRRRLEILARLRPASVRTAASPPAMRPDSTMPPGDGLADRACAEKLGLAPSTAGLLRHRGGRTGHVRPRTRPRGEQA